jgi:hypothetical protein
MMGKSFIEQSKIHWYLSTDHEVYPGDDNIIIGCLQRIALATEKQAAVADIISQNWQRLMDERDMYKNWHNKEVERTETLNRRIRSMKGAYTKLKNKNICQTKKP